MDDLLSRVWNQLLERTDGPFRFRFVLQPMVALLLGIRAGMRDARTGQAPYLWQLTSDPSCRGALLRSAWRDISRVLAAALAMDGIYQLIVFRWIYPLQSVVVAFLLAILPYILIRGPVTRLANRRAASKAAH